MSKVKVSSNKLKVCFLFANIPLYATKYWLDWRLFQLILVDCWQTQFWSCRAQSGGKALRFSYQSGFEHHGSLLLFASLMVFFLPVCDLNRLCSGRQEMWVMLALCVCKHLYPRVIERCHLCLQNTWTDSLHTLTYCLISFYQRKERLDHPLFVEHFASSEAIRCVHFFSLMSSKFLKSSSAHPSTVFSTLND